MAYSRILTILAACLIVGCATTMQGAKIAVDAKDLQSSYVNVKSWVVNNPEAFTEDELVTLRENADKIERFYDAALSLSKKQGADQVLLNVEQVLSDLGSLRLSLEAILTVLQPKADEFDIEAKSAFYRGLHAYEGLDFEYQQLVEQGDKYDAIRTGLEMLKTAIPLLKMVAK